MHIPPPRLAYPLAVLAAVLLTAAPALADVREWDQTQSGTYTFGDAANWLNDLVPGPDDTALFDQDGEFTLQFNQNHTNDRLLVRDGNLTFNLGGETYELTSDSGGVSVQIGESAGNDARLTLSGGTLSAHGSLIDGGDATVTGEDSTWTNSSSLLVGSRPGAGTLTIEDGGEVTSGSGAIGFVTWSEGEVTVTGDGSTWTNSSNLTIGNRGTGTLTIEDGGEVENLHGYLGRDSGSEGVVTVTGDGSTWANRTGLDVGRSGTGALTIEDGGEVGNSSGFIGRLSGSEGTVTVTGDGSTWTNRTGLRVGGAGMGTLTIEDGGEVASSGGYIGFNSGGEGAVTVTGDGSTWTVTADPWTNVSKLYVGGDASGPGGDGLLTVSDGGVVSAGDGVTVWESGTLEGASGFIDADVTNFGMVSPGEELDNPGRTLGELAIEGNFTQEDSGTLAIHFGLGGHDSLSVAGDVDLAGTLELLSLDDYMPAVGTYHLLDVAGGISGMFDDILAFELPESYSWDFSNLYLDGSIAVTPTPTAGVAGLVAMGMIALRRPRRRLPDAT